MSLSLKLCNTKRRTRRLQSPAKERTLAKAISSQTQHQPRDDSIGYLVHPPTTSSSQTFDWYPHAPGTNQTLTPAKVIAIHIAASTGFDSFDNTTTVEPMTMKPVAGRRGLDINHRIRPSVDSEMSKNRLTSYTRCDVKLSAKMSGPPSRSSGEYIRRTAVHVSAVWVTSHPNSAL